MSFDIFDKNKLIGTIQIDSFEMVISCKDCTYFGDNYCFGVDEGYCIENGIKYEVIE